MVLTARRVPSYARCVRVARVLFAAALASGVWILFASDAAALGPVTAEAAIAGGYAGNPEGIEGAEDLGWSLGGRVGVSVTSVGVYAGLTAMYSFGGARSGSITSSGSGATIATKTSWTSVSAGVEGGYDFGFGEMFVLRPLLGAGFLSLSSKLAPYPQYCCSSTSGWGYVGPGVAALLVANKLFLGAEANVRLYGLDDPHAWGYAVDGQAGVRF
jgi:hypothetical protein